MAARQSVSSRPFQVVVFGATGFMGRLVCERILQEYQVLFVLVALLLCGELLSFRSTIRATDILRLGTAETVCAAAQGKIAWAAAARSRSKLESLKQTLAAQFPAARVSAKASRTLPGSIQSENFISEFRDFYDCATASDAASDGPSCRLKSQILSCAGRSFDCCRCSRSGITGKHGWPN